MYYILYYKCINIFIFNSLISLKKDWKIIISIKVIHVKEKFRFQLIIYYTIVFMCIYAKT